MLQSQPSNVLERNLHDIAAAIVRMLSLTRESTELAKKALLYGESDAAQMCIDNDKKIDAAQLEIEQTILTVIARYQPTATNLRFLGAMHRALSDIERAGDYAEHVARAAVELASQPQLKKYTDLARILDILVSMLDKTSKAIAEADVQAAHEAGEMDDEVDELYQQIQRELLTYMMEDAKRITVAIQLLNVTRFLERLGDHLENVNEHVIFWLTNERVQ
jgi:phosphate transport system protein